MEKNQHNPNSEKETSQQQASFIGNQPGQQPPADNTTAPTTNADKPEEKELHSASSFPQSDNETLGTP